MIFFTHIYTSLWTFPQFFCYAINNTYLTIKVQLSTHGYQTKRRKRQLSTQLYTKLTSTMIALTPKVYRGTNLKRMKDGKVSSPLTCPTDDILRHSGLGVTVGFSSVSIVLENAMIDTMYTYICTSSFIFIFFFIPADDYFCYIWKKLPLKDVK